jgi:PAS domain S-box-containing protein
MPGRDERADLLARLRDSEAALRALAAGEVDAVTDPVAGHAVLLRAAQQALHRSEERYRSLFEHANDFVCTYDRGGVIRACNGAGERLTGYTRAELVGTRLLDLVAPEHRPALAAGGIRPPDGAPSLLEFDLVGKDGRRVTVEASVQAIDEPDGVRAFCVIARDVTGRKELEARLRQAQKMEAIGQLAGGIAHDFNNLLTVICGRAELLLARSGAGTGVAREAEVIKKTAERAARLTRQLLAFSRKQILAPRVVDLNAVVEGLLPMLRRVIPENIAVVTELACPIGSVKADVSQLEQVILNLAVNSRDAMPEGGTLRLETRDVDLDAAWAEQNPGGVAGAYVALVVRDTGVGMAPEVQARIFEPFFTTKDPGEGTGLGLATVYGIVKQSGGYIAVESAPGRGAAFTVYLPRVEDVPEPTGALVTAPEGLAGDETVLLVEDDDDVRATAGEMLERYGYRVLASNTALPALIDDDGAVLLHKPFTAPALARKVREALARRA